MFPEAGQGVLPLSRPFAGGPQMAAEPDPPVASEHRRQAPPDAAVVQAHALVGPELGEHVLPLVAGGLVGGPGLVLLAGVDVKAVDDRLLVPARTHVLLAARSDARQTVTSAGLTASLTTAPVGAPGWAASARPGRPG